MIEIAGGIILAGVVWFYFDKLSMVIYGLMILATVLVSCGISAFSVGNTDLKMLLPLNNDVLIGIGIILAVLFGIFVIFFVGLNALFLVAKAHSQYFPDKYTHIDMTAPIKFSDLKETVELLNCFVTIPAFIGLFLGFGYNGIAHIFL